MGKDIIKKENNIKKFFYTKINLFIFFSILIILLIGVISTYIITTKVERETKEEILGYANVFVAGVNPSRIETLTNTNADLENPDYQRVVEQLNKMNTASKGYGIRWVYTMFERNNDIIFGPDSIPMGEYGHSEPGDIYVSISIETKKFALNVLKNGKNEVFGPYADEWGTWLSAFVPIKSFQTGQIIGILGIDIDYSVYKLIVFERQLIPIISTILTLIIFISISIYFTRLKKTTEKLKMNEEKYMSLYNNSIKDSIKIKEDMEKIKNMSQESNKMNKLMVGRELKMIELK